MRFFNSIINFYYYYFHYFYCHSCCCSRFNITFTGKRKHVSCTALKREAMKSNLRRGRTAPVPRTKISLAALYKRLQTHSSCVHTQPRSEDHYHAYDILDYFRQFRPHSKMGIMVGEQLKCSSTLRLQNLTHTKLLDCFLVNSITNLNCGIFLEVKD